jgi:hypothetical protein
MLRLSAFNKFLGVRRVNLKLGKEEAAIQENLTPIFDDLTKAEQIFGASSPWG